MRDYSTISLERSQVALSDDYGIGIFTYPGMNAMAVFGHAWNTDHLHACLTNRVALSGKEGPL